MGLKIFATALLVRFPLLVAFPSYRTKIPNGFRVACPDGVDGCHAGNANVTEPASVCGGIGHATCQGGSMPLNPFGLALQEQNFTWTKALCEADSDEDGLTNGEELGDPCCLWEEYDEPSGYTKTFEATHPGFQNSAAEYTRPECSITAPAFKASAINQFNPWEEQRVAELFVDNFSIPKKRTTYVDVAFNFPDTSMDVFHVVYAEAIVNNAENLHHYVIKGCAKKWPEEKVGKVVSAAAAAECTVNFGGWAPGKSIFTSPVWVGRSIGKAAGIVAFVVNIHYDNPSGASGRVSNDGIRFFYTPTLRNFTASSVSVTQISVNPVMVVPPGRERFFITRSCQLTVTDAQGQPAKIHLSSMGFHAHLLGTEMYSELTKDGQTIDLGSERIWHFDDQFERNILPRNITLQTGDHLQTTCVFNSIGRKGFTSMGIHTTDEMCWANYIGWPGDIQARCDGHVWAGELAAGESGLGIAASHAESGADFAWDGTNIRTGGAPLKGFTDRCSDLEPAQQFCPVFVAQVKQQSDCNGPLPLKRLQGLGLLAVCCTAACEASVCSDHELCAGRGNETFDFFNTSPDSSEDPSTGPGPSKQDVDSSSGSSGKASSTSDPSTSEAAPAAACLRACFFLVLVTSLLK